MGDCPAITARTSFVPFLEQWQNMPCSGAHPIYVHNTFNDMDTDPSCRPKEKSTFVKKLALTPQGGAAQMPALNVSVQNTYKQVAHGLTSDRGVPTLTTHLHPMAERSCRRNQQGQRGRDAAELQAVEETHIIFDFSAAYCRRLLLP